MSEGREEGYMRLVLQLFEWLLILCHPMMQCWTHQTSYCKLSATLGRTTVPTPKIHTFSPMGCSRQLWTMTETIIRSTEKNAKMAIWLHFLTTNKMLIIKPPVKRQPYFKKLAQSRTFLQVILIQIICTGHNLE